jgi:GDPmannose 4,6-dehydratase
VFLSLALKWEDYVVVDEKYMRPEELDFLKGDSTKARKELGWEPKINFDDMIDEMIKYWLKTLRK